MLPDAEVRDGMFLASASSLASLLVELSRLELQEFRGFFEGEDHRDTSDNFSAISSRISTDERHPLVISVTEALAMVSR